ncbi:hypothetical protein DTL42_00385 [Bremerella cremea]|uniref:Efflux RND transporter periplasmic adaptor subunit n=1 Tax=Bremerella cremea TaxID=1031537 RepID=A0A368KZG6_9BACT|nr:HlyD family efflux transporter periplasmic adaptor subunit [Bremerella cremea]RCS56216.1 hypothetical protein DTL42_00385 [Bremerella cremea]
MEKTTNFTELALKSLFSVTLIGAGVAAFFILGKGQSKPDQPPPDDTRIVNVSPAALEDSEIQFEVDGVVVPYREIQLAAEVAGRVTDKPSDFRVGRMVHKGDTVALIDRRDYELELERLQEELQQANNNITETDVQISSTNGQIALAQENLAIQEKSRERFEKLFKSKATTEVSVDDAKQAEITARTTLQTHQDQLNLLRATKARLQSVCDRIRSEIAAAKLQLDRTSIQSPIDGIVVEDTFEQDSYLQKGTALCTIRDTSKLEIKCSLQPYQMKWLWESALGSENSSKRGAYELPETDVSVRYRLGKDVFVWSGRLTRYDGGQIDQQTRMIPCRVQVDNPMQVGKLVVNEQDGTETVEPVSNVPTLMVGMYVQVKVNVKLNTPLVRVPLSAIFPGNQLWIVEDEKLRRRQVSVLVTQGDSAIVYADENAVLPGESIVVSSLTSPFNGAKVKIVEAKE